MCAFLAIVLTTFRVLLVPAQFSDKEFDGEVAAIESIASAAQDYFAAQLGSTGQITVSTSHIVTLSGTEQQYVSAPHNAVCDAFRLVDAEVNFAGFDGFMVLCPGDAMPPHTYYLEDSGTRLDLDGQVINQYSISNFDSGMGTVCHEIMHLLGCPDFYDTDGEGSGGLSEGLGGSFALMDMGNESGGGATPPDLCAPELDAAGLASPKTLGAGIHRMSPMGLPHEYARVNTGNEDEYYLIECRTPGSLIMYHVDRSEARAGYSDRYRRSLTARERWEFNEVNCRPDRQCLSICDEVEGVLVLDNVQAQADGSVSFELREPIALSRIDIYQDAVITGWSYDGPSETCSVNLYRYGLLVRSIESKAYEGNLFAATIDGLDPTTDYTLEIAYSNATVRQLFKTKAYTKLVAPYIYLGSESRDSRGWFEAGSRIPLRLYNAPKATDVSWYFDDEPVECGPDGYYTLTRSGELRVRWGSQTIVKKIFVK